MGPERTVSPELLRLVRCPRCRAGVGKTAAVDGHAVDCPEDLVCESCGHRVPVCRGIPRFVSNDNYATNFGLQWNHFRQTQLDSHSGKDISKRRLFESTAWDWSRMQGARVLDVGCGAGRFAEVALRAGAQVIGVDYSSAIDAAAKNLEPYAGFEPLQASVLDLPFEPGGFDNIYCLGVLQHTPDPKQSFDCLVGQLAPGGRIAIDVYPRLARNLLWSKYWLRPLTKRLTPATLMRVVQVGVPRLLPLSRMLNSIPVIGHYLKYAVPVANYQGVYDLSPAELKEWAILDTFDMLSPEHDHPRSVSTIKAWFSEAGLVDVEVFRRGHVIARGRRPER